ncbi:MAG: AAA family ATPase [Methanomassiliicoccales archaeon]|nr:MAG: AAA family ATPase [Methanomassiliicoccales archaeon]
MTFIFGVTGKGGVGKTTFAALLIRALIEKKLGVVLAVDADPNYNLNEKLGVKIENTIGGLREDIVKAVDSLPSSMSKHDYVEYQVRMALTESENFDLLVMGRQEGPGCYCYINNILRNFVDTLSDNYDFIIIDNEAGMEHLSRRTTKAMNVLFIVSDASKIGVDTAVRIKNLSSAMELKIDNYVLIINRAPERMPAKVEDATVKQNFEEVYTLPNDDAVGTYNMEGKSLLTLPMDSKVTVEVANILSKVLEEKKGG